MAKTKNQDEYDSLFSAIASPTDAAKKEPEKEVKPEKTTSKVKKSAAKKDPASKKTAKEELIIEKTEETLSEKVEEQEEYTTTGKMEAAPRPKGRPKNLYEKTRQVVESTGLDVYVSMMAKRKGMFINEWLRSLILENASKPENKELFTFTDMRSDQVKEEDHRKYGF